MNIINAIKLKKIIMHKVEFNWRIQTRKDGIVEYKCFTFDELTESQLEATYKFANKLAEYKTKIKTSVDDIIWNEGQLIYADGRFVTWCFETYKYLTSIWAKESKNLHTFPIFPDKK